jgi:hypothetical protein
VRRTTARDFGFLLLTSAACAHQPTTDRPIVITSELMANLRVALAPEPRIDIDDSDCDGHDRSRVVASFEELREALLKHGFTVVDLESANLVFEHRTHVTACTFDGQLEGTAQLIAKDKNGRTIDIASMFPLWPEGLVDLIVTSERLADFAANPRTIVPAPIATVKTSTASGFSIRPMEGDLDPALADQLVEYLILRLTEAASLVRDDTSRDALTSKYLRVADRCVLQAALFGRSVTERAGCGTDDLMDAVDRLAAKLAR